MPVLGSLKMIQPMKRKLAGLSQSCLCLLESVGEFYRSVLKVAGGWLFCFKVEAAADRQPLLKGEIKKKKSHLDFKASWLLFTGWRIFYVWMFLTCKVRGRVVVEEDLSSSTFFNKGPVLTCESLWSDFRYPGMATSSHSSSFVSREKIQNQTFLFQHQPFFISLLPKSHEEGKKN